MDEQQRTTSADEPGSQLAIAAIAGTQMALVAWVQLLCLDRPGALEVYKKRLRKMADTLDRNGKAETAKALHWIETLLDIDSRGILDPEALSNFEKRTGSPPKDHRDQ